MQSAIVAGKLFRHTIERLPLDRRILADMLAAVDDLLAALTDIDAEVQTQCRSINGSPGRR